MKKTNVLGDGEMIKFSDLASDGDIIESWVNKMSKPTSDIIGLCRYQYFCTEYASGCEQSCIVEISKYDDGTPRTHEWFPCMKTAQLPSADTPYFKKFVLSVDPDGNPFKRRLG